MPTYRFKCEEHGDYEVVLPMSDCGNGHCPYCNRVGRRMYDTFHKYIDFTAGYDHVLDKTFDSKKARDNHLREKGLVRYKD